MKVLALCGTSGGGRFGSALSGALPPGALIFVCSRVSSDDFAPDVLPASVEVVPTLLVTPEGEIDVEDFRARQTSLAVSRVRYDGSRRAAPNPTVLTVLEEPTLIAIIICPCDPVLDIDPILSIPGIRDALRRSDAPVIAVSPLIAGKATDTANVTLLHALGIGTTAASICDHYEDFIDAMVFDNQDQEEADKVEVPVAITKISMSDDADGLILANYILDFARRMAILT